MKNKKILFRALTAASLAGCAIPLITLGACSNGLNNTNNTRGDIASTLNPDNALYHTVKFDDLNGTVKIQGARIAQVEDGKPIGVVSFPKATKEGSRFKFWYIPPATEEEEPQPVDLKTKVDRDITLYPFFETPIKIKNCVGITAIEETQIWLDTTNVDEDVGVPDLKYSTDYAKHWSSVPTDSDTPITMEPGDNLFLMGENWTGSGERADWKAGFNFDYHDETSGTDINSFATIRFSSEGAVNLVGDIMGLLDGGKDDGEEGDMKDIPIGGCFKNIFAGNDAIKYVSDTFLPSETLTNKCYSQMFFGCSYLKLAPSLPATTLADSCYADMFHDCSALEQVHIKYGNQITSTNFDGWLDNVTAEGQLIYNGNSVSADFLPETWKHVKPETSDTIEIRCDETKDKPSSYEYVAGHKYQFKAVHPSSDPETLCNNIVWISTNTNVASVNPTTGVVTGIRANKEGEECYIIARSKLDETQEKKKKITVRNIAKEKCVSFTNTDGENNVNFYFDFIGAGKAPEFEYSVDEEARVWQKLWIGQPVKLEPGDTVYIKGYNKDGLNGALDGADSDKSQTRFFFNADSKDVPCGTVKVGGSIMGLIDDGRGEVTTVPSIYCFNKLFYNVSAVTEVSASFLDDAKTLRTGCFANMFAFDITITDRTSGLEIAPKLTVTNLSGANSCYAGMFSGCTKLKSSSITKDYLQKATVLSEYCYSRMFANCTSLTLTPDLPATTATVGCYYSMFQGCSSLKQGNIGDIAFTVPKDYSCYQTFASTSVTFTRVTSTSEYDFYFSSVAASHCVDMMINERQTPTAGYWNA